jgi:hypothetical protein
MGMTLCLHIKRTIELRVLEDRVIRVVFVPEMKEAKRGFRKLQMMDFVLCPYHQVSSVFKMREDTMGGKYDMYICGKTGVHSSFWLENVEKETTWKM